MQYVFCNQTGMCSNIQQAVWRPITLSMITLVRAQCIIMAHSDPTVCSIFGYWSFSQTSRPTSGGEQRPVQALAGTAFRTASRLAN